MNRSLAAVLALVPLLSVSMITGGCSSQPSSKKAGSKGPELPPGVIMADNRTHPLAKYIELAGFRLSEQKQGSITVQFAVINHSEADIADLGLDVRLHPAVGKIEEAPFCTFSVKIPALQPRELANVTGDCKTNLRVYELPDWQFIRASFQITSPAP